MKKENYININAIVACLSGKKIKANLLNINDELPGKFCAGCNKECSKRPVIYREGPLAKKHF